MDSRLRAIELEYRMTSAFQRGGWDVDRTGRYDILLCHDGHEIGIVECIFAYNENPFPVRDAKRIKKFFNQDIPLFILTDGANYEVYYDGQFIGSMTVPLSYAGYTYTRCGNAD